MDCLTDGCKENSIEEDDVLPTCLSLSVVVSSDEGLSSRSSNSSNGAASSGCCSHISNSSSNISSDNEGLPCSPSVDKLSISSYVSDPIDESAKNHDDEMNSQLYVL